MRRLLRAIQAQIRYKIILPYLALTLAVMMAGAAISLGLAAASWEDKLKQSLTEMARDTSETLVQRERDHLTFLFQVAFAQENPAASAPPVAVALANDDPTQVYRALLPFYEFGRTNPSLNLDRLIAFDMDGRALVDLLRVSDEPSAEPQRLEGIDLSQVEDVQRIITGEQVNNDDKFSNLIIFNPDPQPYFYTVVPVKQGDTVVGGVLAAIKIDRLLHILENSSEAVITTFYNDQGVPISTTQLRRDQLDELLMPPETLAALRNGAQSVFHTTTIRGREFELAYSPLSIAGRQVGYFSVGLWRDVEFSWLSTSRNGILAIAFAMAVGAVLLGYYVARHITRPLGTLVSTAQAVTAGDLERRANISTSDELGELGRAFNQMTEHLLRLYRTSLELNALIDVDAVLQTTAQTLHSLAPGTTIMALLQRRGGWMAHAAGDSLAAHGSLGPAAAPDTSLLTDLARNQVPRMLSPADDPRIASLGLDDEHPLQSLLLTPLVLRERLVGVLLFAHPQPHAFAGALAPMLLAVANMAASVLCNAVLFTQIQEESSERQAILQSIADGVVVCDVQRNIVLINDAAERMLPLHTPHGTLRNFNEISLQRIESARDELGRLQPVLDHYQVGDRVVTLSSAPVVVNDTHHLGEVIVLHDISEEAAIDRAKTQVIATISHELRTPLTVISGYTELLLRGMIGELSGQQHEMLDQIRVRADQLNTIVKNAVLLANIESGMMAPQPAPQALWEAVDTAVTAQRQAFAEKRLSLHVDLPEDLPPVWADRDHLHHILTQLLDNARRYTTTGGVTINAQRQTNAVQVDVRDTGAGIEPETLKQLFTRFHRVDGNSSPERGGGLGLAITRELVSQLGGQVKATSEVGRGSTFSFTLPIADANADAVVTETSARTTA